MNQELIELGKTVRDSQKLLNKKLGELLNDAEKKVSEWKMLLNKDDFEKSLRITFILTWQNHVEVIIILGMKN